MNPKPEVADKVLSLLRKWGWEKGVDQLRAEIKGTKDQNKRAPLHFFVAWMLGERGAHDEAEAQFRALRQYPSMAAWALTAQAFIEVRKNAYDQARNLLNQAFSKADADDPILNASIHHCYGALLYHEGLMGSAQPHPGEARIDAALSHLHEALRLFGKDHFGTGRVLDTLGMYYSSKDNFYAAREFFEKSIEIKKRHEDDAGVALSHGQLGRLYLDWGHLEKAEREFQADLDISQRIGDARGEAQMHNFLGRVAYMSGRMEDAAAWLDHSIESSRKGHWSIIEGYARKDRALVHLSENELKEAEEQAEQAENLFQVEDFAEGIAHVNRVWGIIHLRQARYDESKRALLAALAYFDSQKERAEAARTQLEVARMLRASNAPRPMVTSALIAALNRAERCRRDPLVREIEQELKTVDSAAHCRHVYHRARGRDIREDTVSLFAGSRETSSIMFLDVQGSTEYARNQDPETVMMTLNQMMSDFVEVLDRYGASVTAYLGDGFMALLRGTDHASRAVSAALDLMESLDEFNRPRIVLGLKPLNIRIGVSTGEVFTGNVGTYQKMDFTAIGSTANLAARLQSEAEPGLPCISRDTYNQLPQGAFIFKTGCPRTVSPKGLGEQQVWDVIEKLQ
jgi:class 3 adenylate cyclase/Tfp pilus assembly protein PilF